MKARSLLNLKSMFQFPVFTISTGMILGLAARAIPALGIHEHPREERLVLYRGKVGYGRYLLAAVSPLTCLAFIDTT
jgi:hypothetical protein